MFIDQLSQYISIFDAKDQPEVVFDTRDAYEFNMVALLISGQWYVLIEHPDLSRMGDIDTVIEEEFNAVVKGWCVLKQYQSEIGSDVVEFSRGDQEYDAVVYHDGPDSCWLLKIEPKEESRLLTDSL